MSKTGISIGITNTQLGGTPQVNANSIIFVEGAAATSSGSLAFALDTPYMLRSVADLETLGINDTNNSEVVRQVKGFYNPTGLQNNSGTILWLVGIAKNGLSADVIVTCVRNTVINSFEFRPRNIMVSIDETKDVAATESLINETQDAIEALYAEGFSTVAVIGINTEGDITFAYIPNMTTIGAPMVGAVNITDVQGKRACIGKIGGWMSSLSVGTSIGDASLPAFGSSFFFTDVNIDGVSGTITHVNTPCGSVSQHLYDSLGESGYIFARTRPPKNGLWLNDGATCEDETTALSTLELGRVLASMVDDLRAYFTPYINNKIPITNSGDIQPTYKQVVLDGAQSKIVQPYIASGDISNARITLVAKNGNMLATRTWEVTLEILAAPTLRWVDGFVFYVSSL